MRFLALDVGDKRIGVAVSDETGTLARPVQVMGRRSKAEDFAAIGGLVRELGVGRVIVGRPLSLNGTTGSQARRVERYARELERRLEVPIVLWDERLSTVSAQRLRREAGRGAKDIDATAAAVILQDYLDALQSKEEELWISRL